MRLLTLLTLGLLLSCSGALAQNSSSDILAPSFGPLVALLSGTLYAAYPLRHSDVVICTTRHSLLGSQWRNYYDDRMQFASYSLQLTTYCGGATGRSRSWGEMLTVDGIGALGTAAIVLSVKSGVQRTRPDGPTRDSFPSGYTATAFLGIELFNPEYGADYPLLAHVRYLLTAPVAFGCMASNRHWYSDILWGGLIGVTMARVEYLANDLIFGRYMPVVSSWSLDQYFCVSPLYSRSLFGGVDCLDA